MKKSSHLIAYFFFTILYLELWHKYFIYQNIWDIGLFYTIFFTFLLSTILAFFASLGKPKTNKIVIVVIIFFLTIAFSGNFIYNTLFSIPFTIRVTTMASQALKFIDIFFQVILKNLSTLLILWVPLILTIIKLPKLNFAKTYFYEKKNLIGLMTITYVMSLLLLFPFLNNEKSAYKLYWKEDDLINSIRTFGFLTAERLDIQRALLGFEEELIINSKYEESNSNSIEYNKMAIDFESLSKQESNESLKAVYTYFKNEIPTKKNEYTGKYQGKNLIFILAESFNSIAVSEKLTPTLYRLTHSGFHFTNFYSPIFLSTTGGEFQAMTSLIPTTETLNNWYKGKTYLPLSLGNVFQKSGYHATAYHNYEATFYNREKTMPSLGFSEYLACLNGLEEEMTCTWSEGNQPNDVDLIKTTLPKYIKEEPFVSYYITMSGHFPYNLTKEKRNYDKVKDLPYSDNVKAYLASQIDLDKALELLIQSLEKEGILDDTVICLVGDHYPYALTLDEINEISSYHRDSVIEVNHSDLILWNNEKDVITIDKVGSQIDILPTLLNLFGFEYDSRLLIGHDLLSDTEGLAIFSDMSWISDSGTYEAKTKTFTPKKEVDQSYVSQMNQWVNNTTVISKRIIEHDIYRKIYESIGE